MREVRMQAALESAFAPLALEIVNDSGRHAGHGGDDGSGETHYSVLIVSGAFEGQSRIARQQAVYKILSAELESGLHALSLRCLSPDEYDRM